MSSITDAYEPFEGVPIPEHDLQFLVMTSHLKSFSWGWALVLNPLFFF